MKEFVTYVLYSIKFDKIYIGFSTSLIQRFYSHNTLSDKGYTVKFRPWIVVYTEFFKTKKEAMKKEKWLKSGVGRKFIKEKVLLFIKNRCRIHIRRGARGIVPPLATKNPLRLRGFFY